MTSEVYKPQLLNFTIGGLRGNQPRGCDRPQGVGRMWTVSSTGHTKIYVGPFRFRSGGRLSGKMRRMLAISRRSPAKDDIKALPMDLLNLGLELYQGNTATLSIDVSRAIAIMRESFLSRVLLLRLLRSVEKKE
jgi:hypothetical protein